MPDLSKLLQFGYQDRVLQYLSCVALYLPPLDTHRFRQRRIPNRPLQDPGGDWSQADLKSIKTFLEEAVAEGDFHPNGDLPFVLSGSQAIFESFCTLRCVPFGHPEAKATGGKYHSFGGA